jgi:hypothetical protein
MNVLSLLRLGCILEVTGLLCFGAAPTMPVGQTNKPAPSHGGDKTIAAKTAEVQIPRSVFEASANAHDPFFPKSSRHPKPNADVVKPGPIVPDVSSLLKLNGINGTAPDRLVMINGCTLAAGEETEVKTSKGKIRIKCVEIRATSVLIAVENQSGTVELNLRN